MYSLTRNDSFVRILANDLQGDFPILGVVTEHDVEYIVRWTKEGRRWKDEENKWDLKSKFLK